MSYLVYARKFRPQTFEEVLGQELVTVTLRNAIRQERIPQSFLFSGPRGVGKTSMARILAKALNCEKGVTDQPCGQCTACVEIAQGSSLDVLEIDGASNRGIDEIRNLRETVKFKPVTGRVKIYIIDEVHMLTSEAFNALLKTLEEPPAHVKFIFATTEPHKVPLTILSRCQRFNFRRIPTQVIVRKLEEIAKSENLMCEKKVFFLIAKASEGALRDAEGLLDQLASFSKGKITEEDVLLMLGLSSEEVLLEVLTALKEKNVEKVFTLIRQLHEGGKDMVLFAKELLEVFRHLLLFQCWSVQPQGTRSAQPEEFVEMSKETSAKLKAQSKDFSRAELLMALSLLEKLQEQLRRNIAPAKLLVESVLLKLLHLDGLKPFEDILQEKAPSSDPPLPSKGRSGRVSQAISPQPRGTESQDRHPSSPASPHAFGSLPVAEEKETAAAVAGRETNSTELNQILAVWPRVIEYVKTKRMSTGIFLSESEPLEVHDQMITCGFPVEFQFHKETLEKQVNSSLVEEALEVVTGCKWKVQFVITQANEREVSSLDPPKAEEKLPEIISEAMNIFEGARIVRSE